MGRDRQGRRYRVAIVATALLLTLAGCNSVLPGGESAAYTASGEDLNGTQLSEDHTSQLESAGSYTVDSHLTIESANQSAQIDSSTMVDLAADRASRTSSITANLLGGGELRTDTYTAGEETYRRLEFTSQGETQVQYTHASAPYENEGLLATTPVNVTETLNARLARNAGDGITWTQTGTVERNGTTLTRYEATGHANFTDFRNESALGPTGTNLTDLDASVSDVSAVMFVDRTGVIHEFRFELRGTTAGESVSLSFVVRTSDIGSTTVAEPSWLDEAKSETDA